MKTIIYKIIFLLVISGTILISCTGPSQKKIYIDLSKTYFETYKIGKISIGQEVGVTMKYFDESDIILKTDGMIIVKDYDFLGSRETAEITLFTDYNLVTRVIIEFEYDRGQRKRLKYFLEHDTRIEKKSDNIFDDYKNDLIDISLGSDNAIISSVLYDLHKDEYGYFIFEKNLETFKSACKYLHIIERPNKRVH